MILLNSVNYFIERPSEFLFVNIFLPLKSLPKMHISEKKHCLLGGKENYVLMIPTMGNGTEKSLGKYPYQPVCNTMSLLLDNNLETREWVGMNLMPAPAFQV